MPNQFADGCPGADGRSLWPPRHAATIGGCAVTPCVPRGLTRTFGPVVPGYGRRTAVRVVPPAHLHRQEPYSWFLPEAVECCLHLGELPAARQTPGRPERQHHDLAAEILRKNRGALESGEHKGSFRTVHALERGEARKSRHSRRYAHPQRQHGGADEDNARTPRDAPPAAGLDARDGRSDRDTGNGNGYWKAVEAVIHDQRGGS